jgi:hypothetical protein
MRLSEARDRFAAELDFPVDRDSVIDELGDVPLTAPGGDAESVGVVVERSNVSTFGSADELFDALVGNVGEAFVGRKFYDDRGTNPQLDEEVSF